MRKLVVAAALLATAAATPAFAHDNSAYIGIDAGIVKPDNLKLRFVNSAVSVDNGEILKHKVGYDLDGVIGWDLGMFRLEGELAYKRAKLNNATIAPTALTQIFQPVNATFYAADGHSNVLSGMINALIDLGPQDAINGSLGGGIGIAKAKYRAGLSPSNELASVLAADAPLS